MQEIEFLLEKDSIAVLIKMLDEEITNDDFIIDY